jgi:hypothetical protein
MRLSAHHLAEHYVKNIITKTKGDDLSELKSITDCKGDVNSMHKLVYSDIRNETTQKEILQFIYQQAKIQAAHNQVLPEPYLPSLLPSSSPPHTHLSSVWLYLRGADWLARGQAARALCVAQDPVGHRRHPLLLRGILARWYARFAPT